ncbi:hypothetical protein S40293_01328 [Stachybotrys chartarum IBT 40293]|nr:hypothetical protein S40293_01328 [Stachybotrys chartarum IBT 40293]
MAPCPICQSIDLASILDKHINKLFGFAEWYPLNCNLFGFSTQYDGLHHPVDGLVLYHKNLDSLRISALSCELCRLVQDQAHKYLRNGAAAARLGFDYPESFELWICGTGVCDFIQVLGYNKACAEKWAVKSASYELIACLGICVDDDDGKRVQLCFPSPVCNEFACLSHCWGLTEHLMLNSHTSDKLWKGIYTSELPRSFQDAIWLANQLGIHYLWIDSLCILQDDVEDWARKSAHMGEIYQNATITIAATQANDSSKGFLDKTLERIYTPTPISVGGIHGQAFLFPIPLKFAGDPARLAEMEDEPLATRGWALQERYMARRTIHFTQDQVLLEIKGQLFSEDSGFARGLPTRSPFTLSDSTRENPAWTQVVERYSRRNFTREQDKLPALAGLAAYFSSIPEDETSRQEKRYLAGLWSTDMVKYLCWRVAYRHPPEPRPTEYRAPTWSWASIDGPIIFQETFSTSLMLVQDAQVELKRPDNIFGEVTNGWIFLKAIQLKPKTASVDGRYLRFFENGTASSVDAGWDTKKHHTKEQLEHSITQEELSVVLVAWGETQVPLSFAGPVCLILTSVEHRVHPYNSTPTYKRVGSGIVRLDEKDILMKLITETWSDAFERGDLADIILV